MEGHKKPLWTILYQWLNNVEEIDQFLETQPTKIESQWNKKWEQNI